MKFVVMAHIAREKYVPGLLDQLLGAEVSLDEGDLGLVKAHVQAWGKYGPDYTCVIQDDAILTNDFIAKAHFHLDQCKREYGRIAMHFYLRKSPRFYGRMKKWKKESRDHVVLPNVYAGLAICLPSEIIPGMLKHFESEKVASGDKRINKYLRSLGMKVYFPLPSLVEHRNLPSLHNGNSSPVKDRVAMWFEHV